METLKKNIILCFLIIAVQQVWAEGFVIESSFGYRNGKMKEYLYKKDGELLSRLDWDLFGILFFNIDANLSLNDFSIENSLLLGVPEISTGKMYDYDWYNGDGEPFTHYSFHEGNSSSVIDEKISLKYKAFENDLLSVFPIAGFQYRKTYITARNGHYEYPSQRGDLTGNIISYSQNLFIIWTGFETDFFKGNLFSLKAIFEFSPFEWASCIDNHYKKNMIYKDTMNDFFKAFSIKLRTDGNFWNDSSIFIELDFFLQNEMDGSSFEKTSSGKDFIQINSIGGTSTYHFSLSFGYRILIS